MGKVQDLCSEIASRRAEALARRTDQYPRSNPIASDISECARETALGILHWQERPPIQPDLKARFERGSLIEETVLRELSALGLKARVERKPFEIRDGKGRLTLRGKVDGFLAWDGLDYPLEVKSVDPNVFRRIEDIEDMLRLPWQRKWIRQLQSYLYANELEEGFFLLDDCLGHWKLIPVSLDYEAVEAILRRCEAAVSAVEEVRDGKPEADALPPFHTDATVCLKCWAFGRVCHPPIQSEPSRLSEPEAIAILEPKLERRAALLSVHREYEDLDKEIKADVQGVPQAIVGRFLIQGKEIVRHLKAQEAREVKTWQVKIEEVVKS